MVLVWEDKGRPGRVVSDRTRRRDEVGLLGKLDRRVRLSIFGA